MNDSADIGQPCEHLLAQAIAYHHNGQLSEAEQLYKKILQLDLMHADANHNLGVLAMQAGQVEAAIHHLEMALLANQNTDKDKDKDKDKKITQYAMSYARALAESGFIDAASEFVAGSMLKHAALPAIKQFRQQLAQRISDARRSASNSPQGHALSNLVKASRKTTAARSTMPSNSISASILTQLQLRRIHAFKRLQAYQELEILTSYLLEQNPLAGALWAEHANALLQQDKPSLSAYQEALRLCPGDALIIGCLAQALIRHDQLHEALQELQRALAIAPDNADLHFDAGNLYCTLQQWQAAEKHFLRAIALQASHAKAHCNLGKCLQLSQRTEEAIKHYRLALAIDPHCASTHHNLGLIFKTQGDFNAALDSLRAAVEAQRLRFLQQDNRLANKLSDKRSTTPTIKREHAHAVLDLLQQQLSQLKLDFCLFAGCALGVYREGDILAHDKDLDIAMHATVDRLSLIDHLQKSGHFRLSLQYHTAEERQHQYSMTLLHPASNITVDIFFLHPDGDDHYLAGAFHPAQPLLCRLSRFDFMPHPWRDGLWYLPANTTRYLSEVYGPNWRQPDRGFDTVLSNPSRIAAAMPAVLCYAYSRLCMYLQERDWIKSLSMCSQILARHPDQLLIDLQAWLSSHSRAESVAK